jgi:hypothetical protein
MALWSAFHTRLMPRVIGCPVPLANAELRNAAAEFFDRTRAWRQWLDPMVTYEAAKEYDLDLPTGAQVVRIESATLDGAPYAIQGAFSLIADPRQSSNGLPAGLSSEDRCTLVLANALPAGQHLQIQASLLPSESSTGIPDHLHAQYADAILNGALYRIRSLAGYDFSDDARGAIAMAAFEREIGRVQGLVVRSNTNVMPRSRVQWC